MRALEIPPTTAPSKPPAMASCVADVSVELVVTVVVEVVEVVVVVEVDTDWLAVTKAEDVDAEVDAEVGLSRVLPPDGRLTSVCTSLELTEVTEDCWEVTWT